MSRRRRGWSFAASIPERLVRSTAAVVGGGLHELALLLLPRFVRTSRLYEATAKNLLRVSIELVGGVQGASSSEPGTGAGQLAVRKGAGNVVELGSIAAFGFSPLWLLAAAADVTHGSRVYLRELVSELLAAALARPDEPTPAFEWYSQPMNARIDLEDKEAVRGALEAQ